MDRNGRETRPQVEEEEEDDNTVIDGSDDDPLEKSLELRPSHRSTTIPGGTSLRSANGTQHQRHRFSSSAAAALGKDADATNDYHAVNIDTPYHRYGLPCDVSQKDFKYHHNLKAVQCSKHQV